MLSGGTFRKTFLIVTGSAGVFVLIFMIISTQYLTLTTNTFYKDIRNQLSAFGNYAINESSSSKELTASHNHTSNKILKISRNLSVVKNKSDFVTASSFQHVENEISKVSPQIVATRNRTSANLMPVLVKNYEFCFNFSIDKPDICHSEQSLPLLLVVISSVSHRSSRNAVRATWGGYASELGIPVFFLLGSTRNEIEQRNIEREDELFEDIVQENCLDTYRNMTLKTVSMMKWIATYCSHVPFVLKTDDDMIVNIDRLLHFLRTLNSSQPSIYGRLAQKWKPHRFKHSKWYVSNIDYRGQFFPDFTTGPAYLFTSNVASKLYQKSLSTSFLFLEDVFMTGIVAQNVGVKRINNRQFHNTTFPLAHKAFGTIITSHGHSPRDMRHVWFRHNVYSGDVNRNIFRGNH